MSWLFSRALVAEFLAENCLDGELYALSKSTPMPLGFLSPDRMMDFSRLSRFGMTFAPLTEDLGADVLMWFLVAFRAKTSASQGTRSASRAIGADCGERWPASFVKFDHASSSWKTSQRCFLEEWASYSEIWPRWGLMHAGECWELPTLAATKPEKGYGLWPTLKASDGEQRATNLAYFERRWNIAPDLQVIVALRTPPTEKGFYGRLNPDWCEWLTGWPIKWTESTPLETGKILEWLQQHGGFSAEKAA